MTILFSFKSHWCVVGRQAFKQNKNKNYLDYVNSGIHKYTTKYLIKFFQRASFWRYWDFTAEENPAVIIHHKTAY